MAVIIKYNADKLTTCLFLSVSSMAPLFQLQLRSKLSEEEVPSVQSLTKYVPRTGPMDRKVSTVATARGQCVAILKTSDFLLLKDEIFS